MIFRRLATGLKNRDWGKIVLELRDKISPADNENFDPQAAVESFLITARKERYSSLLTAEQNYTEFLIGQLNIQMEEIRALQKVVCDVSMRDIQ